MERLFQSLERLHRSLQLELPVVEGNPCGDCRSCCDADGMVKHSVSPLELDFLESKVGREKTERFRNYLNQARDAGGELLYEVCPNHDGGGCTVHAFRPYACRLYGHYRTDDSPLVSHCVFRDSVRVVPIDQARELLPYQVQLTRLSQEYSSYQGPPPSDVVIDSKEESKVRNPRDRAAFLMTQERYEEARDILLELVEESPDYLLRTTLGRCYQQMGQPDLASQQFEEVVRLQPDNSQARYELGTNLFFAGRPMEAREALQSCLELEPGKAMAIGFLGMTHAAAGDLEKTLEYYEKAVKSETYPTAFRYQLAQLYLALQRPTEAERMFKAALECEFTAEQALSALESFQGH